MCYCFDMVIEEGKNQCEILDMVNAVFKFGKIIGGDILIGDNKGSPIDERSYDFKPGHYIIQVIVNQ